MGVLATCLGFTFGVLAVTPQLVTANTKVEGAPGFPWYETVNGSKGQEVKIRLYLFVKNDCPNCKPAKEFAANLQLRRPWVDVNVIDLDIPNNHLLFGQFSSNLGKASKTTPAFFYCRNSHFGFTSYEATGKYIEADMKRWHAQLTNSRPPRSAASEK